MKWLMHAVRAIAPAVVPALLDALRDAVMQRVDPPRDAQDELPLDAGPQADKRSGS